MAAANCQQSSPLRTTSGYATPPPSSLATSEKTAVRTDMNASGRMTAQSRPSTVCL